MFRIGYIFLYLCFPIYFYHYNKEDPDIFSWLFVMFFTPNGLSISIHMYLYYFYEGISNIIYDNVLFVYQNHQHIITKLDKVSDYLDKQVVRFIPYSPEAESLVGLLSIAEPTSGDLSTCSGGELSIISKD